MILHELHTVESGNRLLSTKILFINRQLWTTSLSWLAKAVCSVFQLVAFCAVGEVALLIFLFFFSVSGSALNTVILKAYYGNMDEKALENIWQF